MKHEQLALQLAIYRDLKGAERAEVDEHLRECAECTARLRDYQAQAHALAGLPALPIDPQLREGFYTAIGLNGQTRLQQIRASLGQLFHWTGQLAGAAVIVLVMLATWALFQALGNSGITSNRPTLTPPPPEEAWVQVRLAIPGVIPVYRPGWLPARFDGATISATVQAQASSYQVTYRSQEGELIHFVLGEGMGATGNTARPETSERITLLGVEGELFTSTGSPAIWAQWQEDSRRYQVLAYGTQMSRDDFMHILDGLEPVAMTGNPFVPTLTPVAAVVGVTPVPMPATVAANRTVTSTLYGISFEYPANWQPVQGAPDYYSGADGFFQLTPLAADELTPEQACDEAMYGKLPTGARPTLEPLRIQKQPACLILQPKQMSSQSGLVVTYPRPLTINGKTYAGLALWIDVNHAREIAGTVRFVEPAAPTLETNAVRDLLERFMQARIERNETGVLDLLTDRLRAEIMNKPVQVPLLQVSNPCWYRYMILDSSQVTPTQAEARVRVYEHFWAGDNGGGLPRSWEQALTLTYSTAGWRVDRLGGEENARTEPGELHGPTLSACSSSGSSTPSLAPVASPATPAPVVQSRDFSNWDDAVKAAPFSLLHPTFIPDNLPFYKAWQSDFADGSQTVRILYTVSGTPLDPNQKMVDVQLNKTETPVTLDSVTHQFRETALDVRGVKVRGQAGYTYWSPAAAAGNSAVLMWREGALNIRITLWGDWPQPSGSNPHGLDDLLFKIAESLQ